MSLQVITTIVVLEDDEDGTVHVGVDFPGVGEARKSFPDLAAAYQELGEIFSDLGVEDGD